MYQFGIGINELVILLIPAVLGLILKYHFVKLKRAGLEAPEYALKRAKRMLVQIIILYCLVLWLIATGGAMGYGSLFFALIIMILVVLSIINFFKSDNQIRRALKQVKPT